jgi:hypothetical protein
MFMVGKGAEMGVMWCIVPSYNHLVALENVEGVPPEVGDAVLPEVHQPTVLQLYPDLEDV